MHFPGDLDLKNLVNNVQYTAEAPLIFSKGSAYIVELSEETSGNFQLNPYIKTDIWPYIYRYQIMKTFSKS